LIADGDRWADWLVDESDVDVTAGETGTVVDGGEERAVDVGAVTAGRSVRFTWWPTDDPGLASSVELTVVETNERAVLRVVEVFPPVAAPAAARAAVAWEVRACSAWMWAGATARV